jgi:hypothetical protein
VAIYIQPFSLKLVWAGADDEVVNEGDSRYVDGVVMWVMIVYLDLEYVCQILTSIVLNRKYIENTAN